MADKLSTINFCLIRAGAERALSLDEDEDEMIAANILYAGVADELLGLHAWDFARSMVAVGPPETDVPPKPWAAAYTIPPQFLVLRDVVDADGVPVRYRVHEQSFFCEFADDNLVAIGLLDGAESTWPPAFSTAFKERLIAYFRESFEQHDVALETHKRADVLERKAIGIDNRSSPPRKPATGRFLLARYGRDPNRRRT